MNQNLLSMELLDENKSDKLNSNQIDKQIEWKQNKKLKLYENTMVHSIMSSLRQYLYQDQEQADKIDDTVVESKEALKDTKQQLIAAEKNQVTASRIKFVI